MNLTIIYQDKHYAFEISGSLSLDELKAYLEAETEVAPAHQVLIHNSKVLSGSQTLDQLGIADNDLIMLQKDTPRAAPPPAQHDPIEELRSRILGDPQMLENVRQTQPDLHAALNDPAEFKRLADSMMQNSYSSQQQELSRLQQDPDNPANQARILELIREQQVQENMELAFDLTPEAFTSVHMLFIEVTIQGRKVQAFVDSGAQMTIMSPNLARELQLDHLIDKKFVGQAVGVGSKMMEGRIHSVPISIGDSDIQLPCSFSVLETSLDLLFGLDMLRRHKCVIDLAQDKLIVGGTIETKFLPESQIKSDMFKQPQQSKLGGNIFSDPGPPPVASTAAAAAAAKRQNAATTGSSKRPNTSTPAAVPKYKDEDIGQLMGLGFTREEVITALTRCQGNVEMAASLLFQ